VWQNDKKEKTAKICPYYLKKFFFSFVKGEK